MKNNKQDSFEQFIREKLEHEEVAYNPADWQDMNKRLDALSPKPFYQKPWFLGGSVAAILIATVVVLSVVNNREQPKAEQLSENLHSEPKAQREEVKAIEKKQEQITSNEKNDIETEEHNKLPDNKDNQQPSETTHNEEETVLNTPSVTTPPAIEEQTDSSSFLVGNNNEKPLDNPRIKQPIAEYDVRGKVSGCEKVEVTLEAKQQKGVEYLWSLGDGTYSENRVLHHVYNNPGTYKIELIVKSKFDSKRVVKSSEETIITVYKKPEMEIFKTIEKDRGMTLVTYNLSVDDVTDVVWKTDKGKAYRDVRELQLFYKKRGEYFIEVEGKSSEGCVAVVRESVFVEDDYNLLAPNTFSPNGDGLNDYFIPEALKNMNVDFTMVIQDRRGNIVYETTDVSQPWDGINRKTGKPALETTYLWFVKLTTHSGEVEQYAGEVLIKRN